jgi:AraC-like DNA-binding protein
MPLFEPILYTFTYKFRPWFKAARDAGIDVDRFLARKGVTEAQLLDPSRRMLREQCLAWVTELFDLIGDPQFGLRVAEHFDLGDGDLLGYMLRQCPHPLAMVQELVTYSRLLSDALEFEIELDGGSAIIRMGIVGARKIDPFEVDCAMGIVCRTIRENTQGKVNPIEVHLARPRPLHADRYRAFFGAPVTFEAEQCALYYVESALRTPATPSDPRLREILEQRADAFLADLPTPSALIEQIRGFIARCIERGEAISVETTARELGMSCRTLSRRLRETGRSYRELVEEVRREQALAMARDSGCNVTAIAHRVGFADTTTFARAFRRWTGLSPIEYLKKRRGNGTDSAA